MVNRVEIAMNYECSTLTFGILYANNAHCSVDCDCSLLCISSLLVHFGAKITFLSDYYNTNHYCH